MSVAAVFILIWWVGLGIAFAHIGILSTPQRNRTRDAWTRVRGKGVAGVTHFDPPNQPLRIALDSDAVIGVSSVMPIMTSDGPMQWGWAGPQQPEPIRDMEPPVRTMSEVQDALARSLNWQPDIGQERET